MNEVEHVTLVYLDEPCPMCGSEWSLSSGQCQACGEVLEQVDLEFGHKSESHWSGSSVQHRVLGVVILLMCGLVWHFLKIGSHTTNDPLWTFVRVVGLSAIIYCFFVGSYALILGRAPKHHRWQ